jgi:hypothetical protein
LLKVGLLVIIDYAPQALDVLRYLDTTIAVCLAIVVGARFADIGWSRWLGFILVVLMMFVLPFALLFAATAVAPGRNPVDAVPELWISTVALTVLLVLAGIKRGSSGIMDTAG